MRLAVILLLLAGCATPACKIVKITETKTVVETRPVDRYIVVRDRPVHSALLNTYAGTLSAEKSVVQKSKAPTINCLIPLNTAASIAFEPIERRGHRATPAEIAKAIAALSALQAGVKMQSCPKK